MLSLTYNFAAEITDQETLLNGARMYTFEGDDQPSTGWRLSLTFRRHVATENVDEGDLTLIDPLGAVLTATLRSGRAEEITDDEGNTGAIRVDLSFEVTGGERGYAVATGTVRVSGTIAGQGEGTGGTFEGEGALFTVELAVEGVDTSAAWHQPPEQQIPTGTPQRYREPGGA